MRPLRQFQCVACGGRFVGPPVSTEGAEQPDACPMCSSRYFMWTNYEDWVKTGPPQRRPSRPPSSGV